MYYIVKQRTSYDHYVVCIIHYLGYHSLCNIQLYIIIDLSSLVTTNLLCYVVLYVVFDIFTSIAWQTAHNDSSCRLTYRGDPYLVHSTVTILTSVPALYVKEPRAPKAVRVPRQCNNSSLSKAISTIADSAV